MALAVPQFEISFAIGVRRYILSLQSSFPRRMPCHRRLSRATDLGVKVSLAVVDEAESCWPTSISRKSRCRHGSSTPIMTRRSAREHRVHGGAHPRRWAVDPAEHQPRLVHPARGTIRRPRAAFPRARALSESLAVQLLADHEFQSRPDLVDSADLDVDKSERQRSVAHHDIAEVGRNP